MGVKAHLKGFKMRKKRKVKIAEEPKTTIRKKRKLKLSLNIGKLISDYLINCYLYYEEERSVISDHEFDTIVTRLIDNFELVKKSKHIHAHLIDLKALNSFTGFNLIGKFPNIVKLSAQNNKG